MERKRSLSSYKYNGFTLVELLIALTISAMILASVATFSYAISMANDTTDDTSQKQAQLRFASLKVSQLIKQCKLIAVADSSHLAIWASDEDADNRIDIDEIIYIETTADRNILQLVQYSKEDMSGYSSLSLAQIQGNTLRPWLDNNFTASYTILIPDCKNVQFTTDLAAPWSRQANISFNLSGNGTDNRYQINVSLLAWSGHLLDDDGNIVTDDD